MVESMVVMGYGLNGANCQISLSVNESIVCPFCHKGIETQPLSLFHSGAQKAEIFLKCKLCKKSFIGYSEHDAKDGYYHIYELSKGNKKTKEFQTEIIDLSPTFVKIYGEAEFAEQEKLMEICGVGYRKALEFLIKDYLIKNIPEKKEEIIKKQLGNCISEMINNSRIKEIVRRATWLGNDETHYFRKWENKDLTDLKKLIEITVHFITMDILTDKYTKEMSE